MQLIRSLFSDDALKSGIFSLIVTNCDGMNAEERAGIVDDLKESNLKEYLPMFQKGSGDPEIIRVDFSTPGLRPKP